MFICTVSVNISGTAKQIIIITTGCPESAFRPGIHRFSSCIFCSAFGSIKSALPTLNRFSQTAVL
jgi:hypothetical protein